MWKNVGGADRAVRFVIGFGLLVAALTTTNSMIWVELVLGFVLLSTAVVGACPFYAIFKINTRSA